MLSITGRFQPSLESFPWPVMDDALRLSALVGARVELTDVRCVASSTELRSADFETPLNADIDRSYGWTRVEDGLACSLGIDVTVTNKTGMAVFVCSATFTSLYELNGDPGELEDEALEAFAASSGVFSLYPYLREWVQSATTRAGLPALALGTLRRQIPGSTETNDPPVPVEEQREAGG
jgi:preprotein translocase subunit SecB